MALQVLRASMTPLIGTKVPKFCMGKIATNFRNTTPGLKYARTS